MLHSAFFSVKVLLLTLVYFLATYERTAQERSQSRDADDGCTISNANEVQEIYDCYVGFRRRYPQRRTVCSGKREKSDKIKSTSSAR